MIFNTNESQIIKKLPIEWFDKNQETKGWPFSDKLAKNLFHDNQGQAHSSLQEFFISYVNEESDEGSDGCWYELIAPHFFIENFVLYYNPFIENSPPIWYTFEHISYDTIVCAAIRHYVNYRLDNRPPNSTVYFAYGVWVILLKYFLFTNFSIQKLFEEEQFVEKYKKEILIAFYGGFKSVDQTLYTGYLSKMDPEKIIYILVSCGISKDEAKKLTTRLFQTKSYSEILESLANIIQLS